MKNSMVKMIKKVTAAFLAAATVMGATIAATPAIVRADDFNGIKLEELSDHPTSNMNINVIKNAYKVGKRVDQNVKSGDVVYIDSRVLGGPNIVGSMITPHGKDIVVVYNVYKESQFLTGDCYKVNCKSLIDGETFDLVIGEFAARLSELDKVSSLGGSPIDVDSNGLQNTFQQIGSTFSFVKYLWPF